METDNPRIEWMKKSGKEYLNFTFKEKLTEQDARVTIEKWRKAFQSRSGEKIILVWDCMIMRGYENEARIQWQNALKEMKEQIASICLVTRSNLIQVGASVISVFTSLEIKTVGSVDEIDI